MKKITTKKIHEATPLVPDIIAEIVAEKTIHATFKSEIDNWKYLDTKGKTYLEIKTKAEQTALEEYLMVRAETCFQYNKDFNKKLKSKTNAGIDYLYMFMYHWAGWYGDKIVGSYNKSMENYYRDMKTFNELNFK